MAEIVFDFNELPLSDYSFERLGILHKAIMSTDIRDIVVDITNYEYIYSGMATIIASSIYLGTQYSKKVLIRYNKKNEKCVEFLKNSGILSRYSKAPTNEINSENVGVPFNRTCKLDDSFEIVNMVLNSTPVRLTKNLRDNLFSKICEIFDNAFTHGKSEMGVFCSGFMNQKGVFTFSVYDGGIGICHSVNTYLRQNLSCDEALEWAFKKGHSTLNGTIDFPRGAGLNHLENFVIENDGKINLVSQGGYCHIDAKEKRFLNLAVPIIGTCFCASINTDPTHVYDITTDNG